MAPAIHGSAASKVSEVLGYEVNAFGDTTVIVIVVELPFVAADSIVVEGLRLGSFDRVSRRAPLVLSVNGGLSDNAQDSLATKRVGRPRISVGVDQRFLVGEGEVELAVITIDEDSTEGAITRAAGLHITLPDQLGDSNLVWVAIRGRVRGRGTPAGACARAAGVGAGGA